MNNDRELLELAAKAAGGLVYIEDMDWIEEDEQGNRGKWWNPLTDDGDALRLAVKLGMMVSVGDDGFCTADTETLERSIDEVATPDPYAAARRAIVRAAAEIGKEQK